jgi:hypothetical protein
MSLGGHRKSRTEDIAFTNAYNNGVLSIAAAGNGGNRRTSYPAGYASVVSVAAVDADEVKADFSQYNRTSVRPRAWACSRPCPGGEQHAQLRPTPFPAAHRGAADDGYTNTIFNGANAPGRPWPGRRDALPAAATSASPTRSTT